MLPPLAARRYEVRTELASGGFGHVLEARDRELDRTVAIKVLTRAALADTAQLQRFREEGRVTASLEHPHIVRVLDQGFEDGVPWIVYELVTGGTLRDALDRGPLALADATGAAWQVAAALDAAHARGVLHRDVKPENVLAAAPGHWKLTDFGIARWAGREGVHTATGVVLGTPVYLAPELVRGAAASPASDLYALGVMLFELLAGAPPFQGESPLALIQQHLDAEPPLARLRAPAPLVDLVARLLAKDADRRPASAARVMAELKPELSSGQVDPRAGRAPRPVRLPSRPAATVPAASRRRAGAPVLAGGLALLALGAYGTHRGLVGRPPAPVSMPAPAPAGPAARLAALRTAGEGWDAEARAVCRSLATVAQVEDLAEQVRRRHGSLIVGRPIWVAELARARAKLDGSLERVREHDEQVQRATDRNDPTGQVRAFACLLDLHARHGDGAGALLTWRLLSWVMSELDHRRRLYNDALKHAPARSGDESGPSGFDARWWLPIAIGALEQGDDPVMWFKLAAITHSLVESMHEERQVRQLRPVLDAVPALRACYPDSGLVDLLEADVAQVQDDLPAYRAAMERAGRRFATLHLARGLQSGIVELDCWSDMVSRLLRRSYAIKRPELIGDAKREFERLVPAGFESREPLPERVQAIETKLRKCLEEQAKRRR